MKTKIFWRNLAFPRTKRRKYINVLPDPANKAPVQPYFSSKNGTLKLFITFKLAGYSCFKKIFLALSTLMQHERKWNHMSWCIKLFCNVPNSASFFCFCSFQQLFYRRNCRLRTDSNSNCQSRRWERWPTNWPAPARPN